MRSPAVTAVLGWSGTGKTTLIEALIRELTRRGLRTAAVKFTSHAHGAGAGQSKKLKDTDRFLRAGAETAFLVEGRPGAAGEEGSGAGGRLPPRVWQAVEGADAILSEGRRLPGAYTVLLHREDLGEAGPKYPPEQADRFFLGFPVPEGAVQKLADEAERMVGVDGRHERKLKEAEYGTAKSEEGAGTGCGVPRRREEGRAERFCPGHLPGGDPGAGAAPEGGRSGGGAGD